MCDVDQRLLVGAQVAQSALAGLTGPATDRDRAFFEGKIAVAKFFAHNMLPLLTAVREVVESIDSDVMPLDTEAF